MRDINKERSTFLQEFNSALFTRDISEATLLEVEEKLGFAPFYHTLLFPDGLKQIVSLVEERYDDEMGEKFNDKFRNMSLRIREKILELVMLRLNPLSHRFVELYSKPQYYTLSVKNAWASASRIWILAGDESTDFNYYTKRSLLLSIYKPALSYYSKDTSEGFSNTREFVDKRIDKVMQIVKIKKIPQAFSKWVDLIRGG